MLEFWCLFIPPLANPVSDALHQRLQGLSCDAFGIPEQAGNEKLK